jgi:hypothetical protein
MVCAPFAILVKTLTLVRLFDRTGSPVERGGRTKVGASAILRQ